MSNGRLSNLAVLLILTSCRAESTIVIRSEPPVLPSSSNELHTNQNLQTQFQRDVDILVVGSLASDTICDNQPLDIATTKTSPTLHTSNPARITQSAGGVGRNVAIAAHYAGARVNLASAVADDLAGKTLIDHIAKSGLTTRDIRQLSTATGARTAQYVAVNDTNKDLVVAMADMSIFSRSELESLDYWAGVMAETSPRWVVVDANWSPSILSGIMNAAKSRDIKIAYEPVSVAKATRLFHRDNPSISGLKVVPEHVVSLASPNHFELTALFNAARDALMFESESWWNVIDSFGLSGSSSRDRLSALVGNGLVEQGIPQQCIQLLPFIPNLVMKLGGKGCLVASLLKRGDDRLRNPEYAPYIIARSQTEHSHIGGVQMRLIPPSRKISQSEIISVNGIGDTMLGVIIAGLVRGHNLEHIIPIAQDAAVLTLQSSEAVSPKVRTIQARLASMSSIS